MRARAVALTLLAMMVAGAVAWRAHGPMLHAAAPNSESAHLDVSPTTKNGNANGFLPTIESGIAAPSSEPTGMAWIPGGDFSMGMADPRGMAHGGNEAMNDARPIHRVHVDGFWMDRTDVTNAEFAQFVMSTGYVTVAERKLLAKDFPGVPVGRLVAGSIVFTPPARAVTLTDYSQWWSYVQGADWRHPLGPHSSIRGRGNYPVVQVAYEDSAAYAKWAGKRLPTEAEWEFAARGGLTGKPYAWGDEMRPNGRWMANTFQGHFPDHGRDSDGFAGLAPVASYLANGYGLYDITGNVWQWTSDWYRPDTYAALAAQVTVAWNPKGPGSSLDPDEPGVAKRVQRGGSFLCTEQYCSRYLVGSRGNGDVNSATNHIGFRCVQDR